MPFTDAKTNAKPLKNHPGFTLGSFTPTVGLTARPRTIWVLFFNGVVATRGSKADITALLNHPATKARWAAVT